MSEVTLTAAMRANLASLQGTANLMGQTQLRLATGNKINSALDSPTAYFAAQGLTNRASDLSSLLDGMAQNIQVIKAATQGIDGLTALVNQAKSTAQTAQSQAAGGAMATGTISVTTAGQANLVGFNTIAAGDTISFSQYVAGTSTTVGPAVTITIGASHTLAQLQADLNAISGVSATLVSDSANAGQVFLQIRTTNGNDIKATGASPLAAKIFGAPVTAGTTILASTTAPTDRTALENSYNAIRTQINQFIVDTGYGGKNLLNGDTMNTQFNVANTSKLTTVGTKRDAAGLGVLAANFGSLASIQTNLTQLQSALDTLRVDATAYGNDLAVVQARSNFTSSLISTLKDGASQLTIADKNTEGANLLALQTAQQLGIQALAQASQANQSVLRLFQ